MGANRQNDALDRIAERAGRLYSLPAVAIEVLRLTNCDKVDVAALKACIENDPALATKIMRVVNSSIFGLGSQVSDLGQALALLGTKPLKMLVLGFSLPTGMANKRLRNDATRHVLTRYWRTSLIKAVAARKLATTVFKQDGDEAFLVSLLEDLGMMVLVEQLGETYADFVAKVWRADGDLATLERESLGFEHRQLTVRLLKLWGLPKNLVLPIDELVDGVAVDESVTSLRTAKLAEMLAKLIMDGRPGQLEQLRGARFAVEEFRAERLRLFVEDLQEQVAELSQVLGIDTPSEPNYAAIVAEAHERLASVASDTVVELLDTQPAQCIEPDLLEQVRELSQAVANGTRCAPAAADKLDRSTAAFDDRIELDDPGLEGRVQAAAVVSRQSREPLSLLVIDFAVEAEPVLAAVGDASESRLAALRSACEGHVPSDRCLLADRDTGVSLVLPDCDRRLAKDVYHQISAQIEADSFGDVAICGGAACVGQLPRNFAAADLIDPAIRCLRAAHHAGGGSLKTIEL